MIDGAPPDQDVCGMAMKEVDAEICGNEGHDCGSSGGGEANDGDCQV
jgi:hypothetical protein